MTVAGNLAFASGALYAIALNPAAASFATVTGTATLTCAMVGALGEIRTPDPRIRSPMLYPAELRAQFPMLRISELSEQFYGAESRNVW